MSYKTVDRVIYIFFYGCALLCISLAILFGLLVSGVVPVNSHKLDTKQWGGYYPGEIYQVYDKDTGVYYGITDAGVPFDLYTINGELKLVDQGNEYVVHKNLGEPTVSED